MFINNEFLKLNILKRNKNTNPEIKHNSAFRGYSADLSAFKFINLTFLSKTLHTHCINGLVNI